jgi:hypothetical protein
MKSSIVLPASAYLHFTHHYFFEYGIDILSNVNLYDGGIVEYSIDNGTSWSQLTSAPFFSSGADYDGTIFGGDNPLAGKSAFTARYNWLTFLIF